MKYKIRKDLSLDVCNTKLYRIEALKDFSDVRKGDIGGYIESERNLSQEWVCWVFGDAQVFGDARVYDNAQVYGNAWVFGDARVFGNAWVYDNAQVYGNTILRGYDEVNSKGQVFKIIGFKYPITLTSHSVHIGCEDFTLDQIDKIKEHSEFTPEQITRIRLMITLALDEILTNIQEG
jgi:hypothetical protein